MRNTNGGKVVLYNPCKRVLVEHFSFLVRALEQFMISILGVNKTLSNILFQEEKECLSICIKKVDSLITTNYHLHLPSETQVVQVSPLESLKYVQDIMNSEIVLKPPQHEKIKIKTQSCGMHESKMCNFKELKVDQSKRTTSADRMTGESNKFSCIVSAFGNYKGDRNYHVITDDGVVKEEVLSSEDEKHDLKKKVEKAINKMIWPEQIGQPKRGEHWGLSFEHVVDGTTYKPV